MMSRLVTPISITFMAKLILILAFSNYSPWFAKWQVFHLDLFSKRMPSNTNLIVPICSPFYLFIFNLFVSSNFCF